MSDATLHARYLQFAAAWLCGFMVLVALFSGSVDPYGLFNAPLIANYNVKKVRAEQEGRLFKSLAVERVGARALILGNSRAEIGFDPVSSAWPQHLQPVFNLGLPGTGPAVAAEMLGVASSARVPSFVLLGVDFLDFLRSPRDPLVAPLSVALTQHRAIGIDVLARSLLSIDSTWNSALTVARQHDPNSTQLTSRGFNPLYDYRPLVRAEGYYALFRQKNIEYASRLRDGPMSVTAPGRVWSPEFEQLRSILAFCRERGIATRVVIYPYHADLLEILDAVGLWEAYEDWKRLLVKAVDDPTVRASEIEVWDFGGYSRFATELVPATGDHTTDLSWYWESGHFKPQLGDILIADLFGSTPQAGSRLTSATVEEELRSVRAARTEYRASNPGAVARALAAVHAARFP